MCTQATASYDTFHAAAGEAYGEAEAVAAAIRAQHPEARTSLDADGGTGAYLAEFERLGFEGRYLDADSKTAALARTAARGRDRRCGRGVGGRTPCRFQMYRLSDGHHAASGSRGRVHL